MDNINIYVTVSDKYQWLLKPFCYLFNKFWGENQKVTFLCYKPIKFNLPPLALFPINCITIAPFAPARRSKYLFEP